LETDKVEGADKVESTTASRFPTFKKTDFGVAPTRRWGNQYNPYESRWNEGRWNEPNQWQQRSQWQAVKNLNDTGFGLRPNYWRNDWKTVRLDNKVDARGYHYV
jgi:hypothetical protein